ncbi:MAG: hypothetical protein KDB71_00450 [Mycobacterium sp.]|nr:hypothetical protein [Mycobacterium sp.]
MTGRENIAVIGPPLSGATSLAAALRHRLPGASVLESCDGHVAVAVFVVSAAAPMVGSEVALLEATASRVDAVVAAVSKIDVHRTWRDVLAANRNRVARRCPAVPWVGVAAAPEIGAALVDDLVEVVRTAARSQRGSIETGRQPTTIQRRISRRGHIQHARMQLVAQVRAACATLRAESHRAAAAVSLREVEPFRREVRLRAARVADDLDRAMTTRLAQVADDCGLASSFALPTDCVPELVFPPARQTGLENRLTALLGTAFGVGAAATSDRVLTGMGSPIVDAVEAAAASLTIGVGLGFWLVHTRRLLSARATLDRWIDESSAALRTVLEERVAARLLDAEMELNAPAG